MTHKSLGVCIGASTVSFVENDGTDIVLCESIAHHGNPKLVLSEFLNRKDWSDYSVVATGRKFRYLLDTLSVSEPEAIEEALKYLGLAGKYDVIASLGGENFIVYNLSPQGTITNALTGSKCASGTGEFFLQQIRRMNLNVEEAVKLAESSKAYPVSGRCSVFCKSDCTHALNKGIPKGEVVAGLCKMIADKAIELLSKTKPRKVLVIGGVSQNRSVMEFIRERYEIYIPKEALYFEAVGASLIGLKKESKISGRDHFKGAIPHFAFFEPLSLHGSRVKFETISRSTPKDGDLCILGLDVGSTTTKAVIMRTNDDAILASVYLRTNGDPVGASVECYRELKRQIDKNIRIIGLGVTGSGRHIAGLHALTKGIINEIIAHAAAAAFFDKEVDTIFEVGGQDAKYTYLTNGVASDYAMNETCSAGTGSFLEEAAKETLDIDYWEIGDIALAAKNPPNFNDQCAAFIQSDIKNALQEGISKEDVIAGLVYSVCMNYVNRVKGNRPVGKKVFMQGGVCYNRAVPIAMSVITGKEIVVPPEPGLMGAFGVALEIKKRIQLGLLAEQEFNLDDLINREFKYGKSFTCAGGAEKCDRKCQIAVIEVNGSKYPFGGACSKYYNQRLKIAVNPERNDYVKIRQDLVFKKYASLPQGRGKTIGILKSFLTNTLYPLYYNFFVKLGFRVVLSDAVEEEGVNKVRSAFCFPVEISHGMFQNLINQRPDYIFLPHIIEMGGEGNELYKKTCVFVQGESYCLKSAFKDEKLPEILSPVINFSSREREIIDAFVGVARRLGKSKREAVAAYRFAAEQQEQMLKEFKELGKKALAELAESPDKIAVVLFGRSYNSFVEEANLGIPHKFASRGITVIPQDFLPSDHLESYENMYWFSGQQILKSARFVKEHKQLYGTYITNFSCGPDSFLVDYFRKIMGDKPSLTLELDSHSADVGIDTRIDAFLDIIRNYIELGKKKKIGSVGDEFEALKVVYGSKGISVVDSKKRSLDLKSKEVKVVVPSMGRFGAQALAAVFRSIGVNSITAPVPTIETLKCGRGCTICKECLPFILVAGSVVEYEKKYKVNNEKTLFFVPTGGGPCRQGQYVVKLKDIIEKFRLRDMGILTLLDENSYMGLGLKFLIRGWMAAVISDLMQDIENAILALALDKAEGLRTLEEEWKKVVEALEKDSLWQIFKQLKQMALRLSEIKLKEPLEKAKVVSLTGEIYVRREEFSRVDLIEKLSERGFVVKSMPVSEYLYYCNYLIYKGLKWVKISRADRIKIPIFNSIQIIIEKKIKEILSKSRLVHYDLVEIEKTMKWAAPLISIDLMGEAVLTVGSALREINGGACGVISIGPFACMPSRLAESILSRELKNLPYLHIETDGNTFPQITQSKLEIFMLQAERFHEIRKQREKTC